MAGPTAAGRPSEANLGLAAALRPLDCYVSVDIEDGYADDPDQVADYVARLPVDGINIEDSTAEKLIDPQRHAAKVQAIKQRSPEVFVNARVDTYWLGQDATSPRRWTGPRGTSRQAPTASSFPVPPSPTC